MYRHTLLIVFSACAVASGCATLTPSVGEVFAVRDQPSVEEFKSSSDLAPPPEGPSFVVEMRGANNKSQKFNRPLVDEGTYIQGVLEQSNALRHFGRVKIELWRPRPDGHGYHKMDIKYDRQQKMVAPDNDYALRDRDRLVFVEDESSVLDDMLGAIGR